MQAIAGKRNETKYRRRVRTSMVVAVVVCLSTAGLEQRSAEAVNSPRLNEVWHTSAHNAFWFGDWIPGGYCENAQQLYDPCATGPNQHVLDDLFIDRARGIEFDLHRALGSGGWHVYHTQENENSPREYRLCEDLRDCLRIVRAFHDANPRHDPVMIHLEAKELDRQNFWLATSPDDMDAQISEELGPNVFGPKQYYEWCRGRVQSGHLTAGINIDPNNLKATLRACEGWPQIKSPQLTGKFVLTMHGSYRFNHNHVHYYSHGNGGTIAERLIFPMATVSNGSGDFFCQGDAWCNWDDHSVFADTLAYFSPTCVGGAHNGEDCGDTSVNDCVSQSDGARNSCAQQGTADPISGVYPGGVCVGGDHDAQSCGCAKGGGSCTGASRGLGPFQDAYGVTIEQAMADFVAGYGIIRRPSEANDGSYQMAQVVKSTPPLYLSTNVIPTDAPRLAPVTRDPACLADEHCVNGEPTNPARGEPLNWSSGCVDRPGPPYDACMASLSNDDFLKEEQSALFMSAACTEDLGVTNDRIAFAFMPRREGAGDFKAFVSTRTPYLRGELVDYTPGGITFESKDFGPTYTGGHGCLMARANARNEPVPLFAVCRYRHRASWKTNEEGIFQLVRFTYGGPVSRIPQIDTGIADDGLGFADVQSFLRLKHDETGKRWEAYMRATDNPGGPEKWHEIAMPVIGVFDEPLEAVGFAVDGGIPGVDGGRGDFLFGGVKYNGEYTVPFTVRLFGGMSAAVVANRSYFPDSDGDGVEDRYEDKNDNGRIDDGETNPFDADSDGDTVADTEDNCPTSANPDQADLDGDKRGNVCDDVDGAIEVRRARVRARSNSARQNGEIIVTGLIDVAAGDSFDATEGMSVEIRDGGQLRELFDWFANDCETLGNGSITCNANDGEFRQFSYPLTAQPEKIRFRLRFKRRNFVAPFSPDLVIHLVHSPPKKTLGIDREGAIGSCRITRNGMLCHQ